MPVGKEVKEKKHQFSYFFRLFFSTVKKTGTHPTWYQ